VSCVALGVAQCRDSLLGEVLALTARIDRQVDEQRWEGVDDLVRARQRTMQRLFDLVDRDNPLRADERARLRGVFDSMQENLQLLSLARDTAAARVREHRTGGRALRAYTQG